jgi:hypothetical protein
MYISLAWIVEELEAMSALIWMLGRAASLRNNSPLVRGKKESPTTLFVEISDPRKRSLPFTTLFTTPTTLFILLM